MRLLFIYGPVASGKLTIARLVAERTGLSLFHNHLIVDAVAAVFPFGSQEFIDLRERFWIETISTAARTGRSLVFTFAPEPTVANDFPDRISRLVEAAGGEVTYVALDVGPEEQERRLVAPDRGAFGKLRSTEILRDLRSSMDTCMQAMPQPAMRIDTGATTPDQAADSIVQMMKRL
ncbi:shikimate kinase [Reyranella massiliensis]|uniref:shikimate kinase n=1 Tax=Reyranella massiliensis TaxID=445220 RepID=UPI0002F3641A|nr:shikimate kinase [Reyranella massiliensis]